MSSAVLGRGKITMLTQEQLNDPDMNVIMEMEKAIIEETYAGVRRLTHEGNLYEWYSRNPYQGRKMKGLHEYDRV